METIPFDLERYAYVVYFAQSRDIPYRHMIDRLDIKELVELGKTYETLFTKQELENYRKHNFLNVLIKSFAHKNKQINSESQASFINYLLETKQTLHNAENELLSIFSSIENQYKLLILHIIFNIELEVDELRIWIAELKSELMHEDHFTYYFCKGIVNCDKIEHLLEIKKFFIDDIISKMIAVKISILTFDINKLNTLDLNFNYEYKDFSILIDQLNSEAADVQSKLAAYWANDQYDASNSTKSNFALSEEITEPKQFVEGNFLEKRLIVGQGYGGILNHERNLCSIDISSGSLTKFSHIGKIIKGPVMINGYFAVVSNECELLLLDHSGKVIQIEMLIEEFIICIKASEEKVYALSDKGILYIVTKNGIDSYKLNITTDSIESFLILDTFIIFQGYNCIHILKINEDGVPGEFIEKKDFSDILNVVGINDTVFILTSNHIFRVFLNDGYSVIRYDRTDTGHNNLVVIDDRNLLFTLGNKIFKICFQNNTPVHGAIYTDPNNRNFVDLINCNGILAIF